MEQILTLLKIAR
jgi:hypothetical protein